jgi:hypothetical protein
MSAEDKLKDAINDWLLLVKTLTDDVRETMATRALSDAAEDIAEDDRVRRRKELN